MSSLARITQPTADEFLAGAPATFNVPYYLKIGEAMIEGGQRPPPIIFDASPPRSGTATIIARLFWPQEFVHDTRIIVRSMGMCNYRPSDAWVNRIVRSRYPRLQLTVAFSALNTRIAQRNGPDLVPCWCWDGFINRPSYRIPIREEPRRPAIDLVPEPFGWSPEYAFIGIQDVVR